jgi:hypothetical protein
MIKNLDRLRRLLVVIAFLFGLVGSSQGQAVTYDLTADWSNTSNPNGVWSYREGVNALPLQPSWYNKQPGCNGGGGVDKFRIRIWDKNNGDGIVYDNKMGSSDNSNDSTELGGGSIVIHQ